MGVLNLKNVSLPKTDQTSEQESTRIDEPQKTGDSGLDTKALTPTPTPSPTTEFEGDPLKTLELKPKIIEQLITVYDPEIPINIYELGLIYDIIVSKDGLAVIQMTLTAPNCPAAVTLPAEVQGKVKALDGVSDAKVELVWEPPWSKERMSEAAKLQLGILD